MEKLIVSNFLTLKQVEFEVGKINVIIGAQSTGKSVVAKLLYFFRDFLSEIFLKTIIDNSNKREIKKTSAVFFEKLFPNYIWKHQKFEIIYQCDNLEISIKNLSKKNGKKLFFQIDYSKNIESLHNKLKRKFIQSYINIDENPYVFVSKMTRDELLKSNDYHPHFYSSIFIPASRSFFSMMENNIFSFLSETIEIDPLIIEFGRHYKISKDFLQKSRLEIFIEEQMSLIINGKYIYEDKKDWIESNNKKVNISQASSGQQEVLPLLIILALHSTLNRKDARLTRFFIEEPEAHLFPTTQQKIINLVAYLYNQLSFEFFLTTHSPYILTALNNLILAQDVIELKGKAAIEHIQDPRTAVKFEDVKAYTLENGELKSIMDEENRLIGINIIDSVSDEFSHDFDALLDLKYSE